MNEINVTFRLDSENTQCPICFSTVTTPFVGVNYLYVLYVDLTYHLLTKSHQFNDSRLWQFNWSSKYQNWLIKDQNKDHDEKYYAFNVSSDYQLITNFMGINTERVKIKLFFDNFGKHSEWKFTFEETALTKAVWPLFVSPNQAYSKFQEMMFWSSW